MVGDWKKLAMEGLTAVFPDRSAAAETTRASEADVEKLHAKIGALVRALRATDTGCIRAPAGTKVMLAERNQGGQ